MKFLIIQTAFIGDVVLATPLIEKLHQHYPDATIDFLLRKGNESLLTNHPIIRRVFIFDKKNGKYRNMFQLIRNIRQEQYDVVINAQRFFASGVITVLSGGKETIGFDKNPMSSFFTRKVKHHISAIPTGDHEVKRNLSLITHLTDSTFVKPKLYPSQADFEKIIPPTPYICIAPASVWFTKQYPKDRWIELINAIPASYTIYLMGAKSDIPLCDDIISKFSKMLIHKKSPLVVSEAEPLGDLGAKDINPPLGSFEERGVSSRLTADESSLLTDHLSRIINLAGQLSFLQSAALMKGAAMNYVNDSAPLHFASAMDAPVTAIFCSTVPAFGFGPLSDESYVVETQLELACKPCGLHGRKECPLGHFKCSIIDTNELLLTLNHHNES